MAITKGPLSPRPEVQAARAENQKKADIANMQPLASRAWQLWQQVRQQKPLVQCITNFVSMVRPANSSASVIYVMLILVFDCHADIFFCALQDIMANVLLAAGASPAMVSLHNVIIQFHFMRLRV